MSIIAQNQWLGKRVGNIIADHNEERTVSEKVPFELFLHKWVILAAAGYPGQPKEVDSAELCPTPCKSSLSPHTEYIVVIIFIYFLLIKFRRIT